MKTLRTAIIGGSSSVVMRHFSPLNQQKQRKSEDAKNMAAAAAGDANLRGGAVTECGSGSERTFDEDDPQIDKVGCSIGSSASVGGGSSIIYAARLNALFSFRAILVTGTVIYVFAKLAAPPAERAELAAGCSPGGPASCFNFHHELMDSMDLTRHPCDDFYQYACGLWPDNHPGYRDQLHFLEERTRVMLMKMMRNITLSAQGRPREALTAAERVSLAYDLCTDAYRNRADYSSVMNELIFDKLTLFNHSLAYTTNLNTAVADALATLAVKWNVPLFFQIDLASRPKNGKKITLVVDYSVTLLRWMSHKRALLTPEATARLINLYYELRSVSHGTSDDRALALLQMDEKVTVQWVSVLLSLKGLRSRLRYYSLDHLRHRVGSGQECLEAINRALAPNSTLRTDNAVLTDEHLFASVDDAVNSQWATRSLVRDFVALHVVRQLAPLTSPRFVDALLDNPSHGTSYVASECVSAVSRLVPGASLTNLVFQDPVATERRERALNHLERIWNQTATYLLAANEKRGGGGKSGRKKRRVPLFNLSVVWQSGLAGMPDVKGGDLKLHSLDSPFVKLYLSSVEAIRSGQQSLPATRSSRPTRGLNNTAGLLTLRNAPARYDDVALDEGAFVPTSALFEPFLALDNDPFTLGAFGHFLSRGLWHLILDTSREGSVPGLADLCWNESKPDGRRSSPAEHLISAHLPSIAGLHTAYAVFSRENVTANEADFFSPAQLFYIGSCFQSCSSSAVSDERRRASARSLCNVPLMLSEGFGPAFRCRPESKMMKLARREGACIDPTAAWPPLPPRITHPVAG